MRSLFRACIPAFALILAAAAALPASAAATPPRPDVGSKVQLVRPLPPEALREERHPEAFVAAPELEGWIRATFLNSEHRLFNADHAHLADADIGCLWTNAEEKQKGLVVAATAEMPSVLGARWCKAKARVQITDWFGERATQSGLPDFILTFDSVIAAATPNIEWCARVDHELYHCGQLTDEEGEPRYGFGGAPLFAIKAHDVEAWVGVAERFGPVERNVRRLVEACKREPLIARADVQFACGTCGRGVA